MYCMIRISIRHIRHCWFENNITVTGKAGQHNAATLLCAWGAYIANTANPHSCTVWRGHNALPENKFDHE